ncbi:MAG: enterochelin esterase [Chloroflexota bacterium]
MPVVPNPLHSPALLALQKALDRGKGDELEAFWQKASQQGTPLIEPIQGDTEHSFVTFLWRAEEELKNVVIVGDCTKWDFHAGQLAHLSGTDLWYKTCRLPNDLCTTYWLAPNDMLIPMEESIETVSWKERTATWGPDPLNPNQYFIPKHEEDTTEEDIYKSILEMPDVPPPLWVEPRANVSKGQVDLHRFHSDILDNERRVWIYTPPNYRAEAEPYHLLFLFDGQVYTTIIPTPTILDNLWAEKQIPQTVAILVDSPDAQTRNQELASHPPFADFLTQELLPWVRQNYTVTSNPAQTIIGGSSHGGQGAAYIGLRHPDIFGNVLSQSGSFWWKLEDGTAYEWLTDHFVSSNRPRVKFYLNMGSLEDMSFFGQPTALDAVRCFRDILLINGYAVHYKEYSGGHDYLCWRGNLANGLITLTGT